MVSAFASPPRPMGPYPLGYPMTRQRKRSLIISISFIVFVNVLLPTALFYALKYTVVRKPQDLYGYTSIPMGILQLPQWPLRFYYLCRRNGECSPVGPRPVSLLVSSPPAGRTSNTPPSSRPSQAELSPVDRSFSPDFATAHRRSLGQRIQWVLVRSDTFQWGFLGGLIAGVIPLALSSAGFSANGSFVLLVLTYAVVMGFTGLAMLAITVLSFFPRVKQPLRMSSVDKGLSFRPALAYLWEDLTAVEGAGGYAFRQAFRRRFDSSPLFREMTTVVSLFLSTAFLLYAALSFGLTFALAGHPTRTRRYEDWSFGANMLLFLLWNGGVALVAVVWARRYMAEEERRWRRKALCHMDDWWEEEGDEAAAAVLARRESMLALTTNASAPATAAAAAAAAAGAGSRSAPRATKDKKRKQQGQGQGQQRVVGAGDDDLGEEPCAALALSRISSRHSTAHSRPPSPTSSHLPSMPSPHTTVRTSGAGAGGSSAFDMVTMVSAATVGTDESCGRARGMAPVRNLSEETQRHVVGLSAEEEEHGGETREEVQEEGGVLAAGRLPRASFTLGRPSISLP